MISRKDILVLTTIIIKIDNMPLPKPKPAEKQQDFMNRCMGNPTMNKEYPRQDQRLAVCYTQWRDK